MADNAPAIQLINSEPDGYCDPESGVCVLLGAPAATGSGTHVRDVRRAYRRWASTS